MVNGTRSEGGVFQELLKRYSTTAFSYLSHSAVVSRSETARPLSDAGERRGRERPPPNRGVMRTLDSGAVFHASIPVPWGRSRPHLSLREGSETAAQERP